MVRLFCLALPKSGTTTLHEGLKAAGLRSKHWRLPSGRFLGEVIYEDHQAGRDPLAGLGDYEAVIQPDVCRGELNLWPQLDWSLIRQIEAHNPDCKFLLITRDPRRLIKSIDGWFDLRARLTTNDIPGLPAGTGGDDADLERWILGHYNACRRHFEGRENYLEYDVGDPEAPSKIGALLGTSLPWWGVANTGADRRDKAARRDQKRQAKRASVRAGTQA